MPEAILDKLFFLGTLPIVIFLCLIFGPVLGLLAVLTDGFSRVYALLLGVIIFLVLKTPFIVRSFSSRVMRARSVVMVGLLLGVFGLWVSLVLSKSLLSDPTAQAYATAGFPIRVFTYPMPPMGSDFVPREMWAPFYINFLVWIIVGLVLAILLPRFVARFERRRWIAPVLTILTSLYGLAYLLFQFD